MAYFNESASSSRSGRISTLLPESTVSDGEIAMRVVSSNRFPRMPSDAMQPEKSSLAVSLLGTALRRSLRAKRKRAKPVNASVRITPETQVEKRMVCHGIGSGAGVSTRGAAAAGAGACSAANGAGSVCVNSGEGVTATTGALAAAAATGAGKRDST